MKAILGTRGLIAAAGLSLAFLAVILFAGENGTATASNYTTWGNPSDSEAATGGDNNGFETDAQKAYFNEPAGNEQYALNENGYGDKHIYYDFDLMVPTGSTVNGIQVVLDWKADSTAGGAKLKTELSWDGGTTWSSSKTTSTPAPTSFRMDSLGGPSDTWGRTWDTSEGDSELSNANFRVRLTADCNYPNSCAGRDYSLDWVTVRVYYTPGNLLLNGDFEAGNTSEWIKDGDGSVAADGSVKHAGSYSLLLTPDATKNVYVTQPADIGEVVGRSVTVSGWYSSSNGGSDNRGLYVAIYKETAEGWDATPVCSDTKNDSNGVWASFTMTCTMPSSDIFTAMVMISSTGTTGTVNVDDVEWTATGDGPTFTVTGVDTTPASIPADADIVFVSNRWWEAPGTGTPTPDCFTKEAFVWKIPVGTETPSASTQLTFSGYENIHPAVSPDRNYLAVVRFTQGYCMMGDCDDDGVQNRTWNIWVIDLENGKEYQIVPSWYKSGMGGIVWSKDGHYLYFGMMDGRHEHIFRIHPDGTGLAKISQNDDWMSDVGISKDGQQLLYKYVPEDAEGRPIPTGGVWKMDVDGANGTMISTGADGTPTPQRAGCYATGDFDPEMKTDESQVVFAHHPWRPETDPDGIGWDIIRQNTDGTGRTTLALGSATRILGIPDWQVDSNLILFTEWNYSDYYQGCVTMNSDGSNYTRIEEYVEEMYGSPFAGGTHCRWIDSFSD